MHRLKVLFVLVSLLGLFVWGLIRPQKPEPATAPTNRFEVFGNDTSNCTPTSPHFCPVELDHLNAVTTNGKFLASSNDSTKSLVNGAGNFQCADYEILSDGYGTITGVQKADNIRAAVVAGFPNGTPQWLFLNEISPSLWQQQNYRWWIIGTCQRLHNTYNHEVIVAAPFQTINAHPIDWQSLADVAHIGIECYLSGPEIRTNGMSVSWCQSQYQASKNSYVAQGIAANRLFLIENFGCGPATNGWGRAGESLSNWLTEIGVRSTAAHNVGFQGYCSYQWGGNGMGVSDSDMTAAIDAYCAKTLP
jgi:hypothetical protein